MSLSIYDTSFLRVWVNSKSSKLSKQRYSGMRILDESLRAIYEYNGTIWRLLHCNKTCMRNIEVIILDDGNRVFI